MDGGNQLEVDVSWVSHNEILFLEIFYYNIIFYFTRNMKGVDLTSGVITWVIVV